MPQGWARHPETTGDPLELTRQDWDDAMGLKYEPITETGCWIWLGAVDTCGYGMVRDNSLRRNKRAHRVSYELLRGPIPAGLTIDHLCRVKCCVNPDHL